MKACADIGIGGTDHSYEAGYYMVSGRALTAVDLVRYPRAAGSLHAVATVVAELSDDMVPDDMHPLLDRTSVPVLQRLGYILDHVGRTELADEIHRALGTRSRRVELDNKFTGDDRGEPIQIDERWKVVVRRPLETDHASR